MARDLKHCDDGALVRALRSGEDGAWAELLRRTGDLIYTSTLVVFPEPEASSEYLAVLTRLRADGFAVLADFDGRSRLTTWLRLKLGDLFAERILRIFDDDAAAGWQAFERFYGDDLRRIVARRFAFASGGAATPDGQTVDDLYQEVCCLLVEQDYRRIRTFDRRGSFAGYLRRVVRNLCTDLARKADGRRRLPEKISRRPLLEQEVFRLLHWSGVREAEIGAMLKDPTGAPYPRRDVERAVARVREAAGPPAAASRRPTALSWRDGDAGVQERDLRDDRPSPEARLLEAEQEQLRDRLVQVLDAALGRLPAESQLYVRLRFYTAPPKPPREIARLLGRPEEEVYRLRERTIAALRAGMAEIWRGLFPGVRLERT